MIRHFMIRRNYISNLRPGKGIFVLVLATFAFAFFFWIFSSDEIELGTGETIILDDYERFEDELNEDFETVETGEFQIPRILHQTWKNQNVPAQFHDNIRSFISQNPAYLYYFWTDESARMLIEQKHPYLLETYDNYVEPVRRADMIRYVVLYEYGGIYADLDTKCLRPLDRVLKKYACVLSPEPYEHASLVYAAERIVTNSIMFCNHSIRLSIL